MSEPDGPPAAHRRPNIAMILTDDHATHAIGVYGSVVNHTPRIDDIARRGVVLERCFATNSLCAPSRANLLTGTYSHVNGVRPLRTFIDASQPTFVTALRNAGYRTAIVGKWHMGDGETVRRADLAFCRGMSGVSVETVRLFLHVLAASAWVGGQITLAALVPALRAAGTDGPRAAANAFNRVAWPAFGILVLTGLWNVVAEGDKGPAYQHTLAVKYTLVIASGVTAFIHARVASRKAMAVFGALTGLTALATLFVGIMLAE